MDATGTAPQRFAAALDALVADIKCDRSILAALLCGSLSHDVVWDKSDIDLVLVTVDDKPLKGDGGGVALDAGGVNVHALLLTRADFRKAVEGAVRNSWVHSFLAKGRLLYTHDPTIADLCANLAEVGRHDADLQLLRAATHAQSCLYKARKWLITRGDLHYTALWILYAATPIAQIEVISRRLIADREVIPQARALNPALFATIYLELLTQEKTQPAVEAALTTAEQYLAGRAPRLFAPIVEYLREVGEARSARDLEHHFSRHWNVTDITTACEYLADQGLLGKAGLPVKLTKRSTVHVQELAFFYLDPGGSAPADPPTRSLAGPHDPRSVRPGRARWRA
jgi:hypothetical protein